MPQNKHKPPPISSHTCANYNFWPRDIRRSLKSYWLQPPYLRTIVIAYFGYDARTTREVEETRFIRQGGIKDNER
jgi:hypothetical protein